MADHVHLPVLIVESSHGLGDVLVPALKREGYRPTSVVGPDEARHHLTYNRPSAIVVSLDAFDDSIEAFVREARAQLTSPIVVVHQDDNKNDALRALEAGADDYVCGTPESTKDDATTEFIVRLNSAVRTASRVPNDSDGELSFGKARIDLAQKQVYLGDQRVGVTQTEYRLLVEFMRNPESLLTAESLLESVWGEQQREQHHYVRVYIHRLRRLMGWDREDGPRIETQRGRGYMLTHRPALQPNEANQA